MYLAELVDATKPERLGGSRVVSIPRNWATVETPVWVVSLGGLAAAGLMVGLLALILQRQWINPARSLASAAEKMAAGEWHARVDPAGAR